MKILVVGGAGYIGSVCAELLLDEGHTVSIFDNLSEGHRAAIDPFLYVGTVWAISALFDLRDR